MNDAIKGALLSGLVFPGMGQIALKHYKRGAALILIFSAGLLVVVVQAIQQALIVLEKMESGGGAMDLGAILDLITQGSKSSGSFIFNIASGVMIVCWIFGIIDAYRIGRKKRAEEQSPPSPPQEGP